MTLRTVSTTRVAKPANLPPGWAVVRLKEIATLVNGFSFGPRHWKRSGLPIIRIQNLNNPNAPFNYCQDNLPDKFRVHTGELLFAWSGTPGTSFGAHIWTGGDAWLNQHIFKVEFDRDLLDVDYLRAALNHNLSAYIAEAQGGSGLAHINKTAMDASPIRVAPRNEQRRIVTALAELFLEISAGDDALNRARASLKHFSVSVLRAAVEGTLTSAWRASRSTAHAQELVSESVEGIPATARRRQKAPRSSMHRNPPLGSASPSVALDSPLLSGLPASWVWTTVEQIGEVRLGRQRSPQRRSGSTFHPYLRVANVFENYIDTTNVLQMPFTPSEIATYRLTDGDVLLNEGQSLELVGRPAIYRGEIQDVCFQNTLIRFRAGPSVLPEFALIVFRFYLHSGRFQRAAKWTTNIAHLSVGRFAVMEFPLPPLLEQQRIADEVEANLFHVKASERSVDAGLTRSEYLRSNAIRAAFQGQLVDQDPTDEPASLLVEQISQSLVRKRSEPRPKRQHQHSGLSTMTTKKRRSILDVLKAHPKGITPEELLRASGYDLDEVDEFYAALRPLMTRLHERRPSAKHLHSWPKNADIILKLKKD